MGHWANIQHDVLARVIELLPSDDVEQVACVCKAWKQVSDTCVRFLRPRTVPQVTWAKRFPQLVSLDLSAASYDSFDALFHGDVYWSDSGSDQEMDTEAAPVPETVKELAWGSEYADDYGNKPSAHIQAPGLNHGDRRWHVVNAFTVRLPTCLSVTSLEITGKAETYALCSHVMAAPEHWTPLLKRQQRLRLSNSSDTTAAAAVCLCLATSLTSVHISGSPSRKALSDVQAAVPYLSPDQPVPHQPTSATPQTSEPQGHGVIRVPVSALQLIASAAMEAKQLLPCPLPRCHAASSPASPSNGPASTPAAIVKDHAVILPQLLSITTDAARITSATSVCVLDQHPPSDLLTVLPDILPQQQQDQYRSSSPYSLCLCSVAVAVAARALTLPTTPPSAPAWIAAHPSLNHLDAPRASLHHTMPVLANLTALSLKRVLESAASAASTPAGAGPQLRALTFPLPLNLQSVPRTLPVPGVCPHLTLLHLSPPERTTLPFSTLARLVLECPALEDLDVSRCLTAPPSFVIAPRAATPVHYFLHTQTDIDAEHSIAQVTAGGHAGGPPAPLRRFVCDASPGCLYLLPLLDAARPVRRLEEVSLSRNLCLPGRLIGLLAEQPRLQRLQLLGSSRSISPPQDTAVLALVALSTSLTAVSLSPTNPSCTQACILALMAVLPCLTGLCTLSLPHVAALGNARPLLQALSGLKSMRSLDISHGRIFDEDVETLVQCCPRLSSLSLAHSPEVTSAAAHALLQLRELESLDLTACIGVADECGPALACMTSLTWLSLACTSCGAAAARDLTALPRLRHVVLCPHWQLHTGRGKGGSVLVNRGCNTTQREDMVLELAQCQRLRRVEGSSCLLAKARSRLMYEGLAAPRWMI